MRTFFTQGDHKITKTYQFKLPSRTDILSSPLLVDIRPPSDSQDSLPNESRFGWNWYLCIPVTCEFTTRSSCTSSSDEPNLVQLDESSANNWSISKLILNAFKTLLQFQQEAFNDVIFSNPLTACVCSRKTTWRRKFVDFMNFNERFLLNYNELDLQTSRVT